MSDAREATGPQPTTMPAPPRLAGGAGGTSRAVAQGESEDGHA
ncbi:hypothetical protein [Streptomyces sp. NPDC050848]